MLTAKAQSREAPATVILRVLPKDLAILKRSKILRGALRMTSTPRRMGYVEGSAASL